MLVISRYADETVMIGDDRRITVSAIRGDRVTLTLAERVDDGGSGRMVTKSALLRLDETIGFGIDVRVSLVNLRSDRVRLGITAPRNVSVHRQEVYDALRADAGRPPEGHGADGMPGPL
jgi:carbon storage regulator